jgi:hypothetical protein
MNKIDNGTRTSERGIQMVTVEDEFDDVNMFSSSEIDVEPLRT